MNSMKWFVMLNGNGVPLPLVEEDDVVALFVSEREADAAARANPLGQIYGYETYVWDYSNPDDEEKHS